MDQVISWKWVPEKCELDKIDLFEFMSVMQGMNVGFFGDSLNENFVVSLLCVLRVADFDARKWKRKGGWKGGPATANAAPIVSPQMMVNFGMFGQGQVGFGLNPMFGGLIMDPSTGLIAANPMYGSRLLGQVGGASGGLSGYYSGVPAGLNVGVNIGSLLGGYGGTTSSMLPGVGLQNVYPGKKEVSSPASGSTSGSRSQGAGAERDTKQELGV